MIRKVVLATIVLLLAIATIWGGSVTRAEEGSLSGDASNTSTSNIQVERSEGSSVIEGLENRIEVSWPWYLTRASGLVAALCLVILMLSGIGLVTGHTFSFLEPITAWASHRALGIAFGVAVLLHIGSLYFDKFVPFSLASIFIPFISNYKPTTVFGVSVGSLYVALGVLSLYMVAAVIITSLLWIEKKPKLWKLTHLLSYLTILFVFVHGLYLGTDLASGPLRWAWIAAAVALVYASLARLWRANTV